LPYLILLTKSLKSNCYIKNSKGDYHDNEIFDYKRIRSINIKYDDIIRKDDFSILFEIIQIIETANFVNINSELYNSFNNLSFFTEKETNDSKYFDNKEFIIRKSPNPFKDSKFYLDDDYLKDIHYLEFKVMDLLIQYNIVPYNFIPSYFDSFISMEKYYFNTCFENEKWRIVFCGSYNDCSEIFNNPEKFDNLVKSVSKEENDRINKRNKAECDDYYFGGGWKEDYYNAMTDGQYGDYNDFDGNIDEIDTWSKGD
jgi:hypothetical protein